MTALPAITDFTDAAVTEAEFKSALTNLRAYLAGLLGTDGTAATALDTLATLFAAGVSAKSVAYTVATTDRGTLLNCTGTWTLTLLAAATAGTGFAFAVRNSGSGVITLDGNASETIDGATTFALPAGTTAIVVCTGSAWLTVGYAETPFGVVELAPGADIFRRDDATAGYTNTSYPTAYVYGGEDMPPRLPGSPTTFRMEHYGEVTASFDLRRNTGTGTAYGRVLKNGTQVQEWTSTSESWSTKTANVPVAPGDVIEFQQKATVTETRNRRLYVTQLTHA